MVVIAQAVKTVATRRPIEETRKSWLNLLNFMRFLRRGPIAASPMRTGWVAPYLLYGVLLVRPLQISGAAMPASMRTLHQCLLRSTASRCRALALPRGPIAVERSYLCVTAATAVGWA